MTTTNQSLHKAWLPDLPGTHGDTLPSKAIHVVQCCTARYWSYCKPQGYFSLTCCKLLKGRCCVILQLLTKNSGKRSHLKIYPYAF